MDGTTLAAVVGAAELPLAEAEPIRDHEDAEASDDDGFDGCDTTESADEVYLDASNAGRPEETAASAEELKIMHSSGDCKIKRTYEGLRGAAAMY